MSDPTTPELRAAEFAGIFIYGAPVLGEEHLISGPPQVFASRDFTREVREALALTDEQAERAADWIADKMERFGALTARPVFDLEGVGPQCSWCSMVWPLCGHDQSTGVPTTEVRDGES
ncbi:hypothetical protein MYP14_06235 [Rhodococcus pyridinivorans]|uniref:hypothetical protein n=1 Tax=Rhodococcus pyridinivorans TaxID=103816 RepID=UPI001FFF31D5|nr:hypothetical protein [Rhodococcus pyridinivorans]UPK64947.1 hypothetical protein MYP14_06235 [Rhodococcus pyridinivorans]